MKIYVFFILELILYRGNGKRVFLPVFALACLFRILFLYLFIEARHFKQYY